MNKHDFAAQFTYHEHKPCFQSPLPLEGSLSAIAQQDLIKKARVTIGPAPRPLFSTPEAAKTSGCKYGMAKACELLHDWI